MRRLLFRSVLLLLVSINSIADEYELRTLTSREGVSIRAWILKVENGQVTIRKDDGKVMTFPVKRLCDDDQAALGKVEPNGGVIPSSLLPDGNAGQSGLNRRVYPRTLEEMKAECAVIRAASVAKEGFTEAEEAALVELNIHRYLSGVPGTVGLNRKFCEGADKASEACAKIGKLSHESSPEGMCCNLHQGQSDFADTVHGYMEDSGENNREHRGHRAWCLHPDLALTGFGQDASKHYYAMWVSDGSSPAGAGGQRKKRRSGFHCWPGEGLFPVKRMKGDAWTVYPPEPVVAEKLEIRVFELAHRLDRPLAASATPEGARKIEVPYTNVATKMSPWAHGSIVFRTRSRIRGGKDLLGESEVGAASG